MKAIIDFVTKLARTPPVMDRQDAEALRSAGLSDRQILEVTLVAAYFCFVNRIAHGLGVELEGYWK